MTPQQAESALLRAGFILVRSKGSHRIYRKEGKRMVVPFHAGAILHPKIVKRVLEEIGEE
jgi:predicted RNA binding protein YcfA (HicA-like mRNA interferase family)